ncbi:MAG: pirin family protein [Rhodospirillales bacterium]|nr:pirin family protein [Rhodospirillales bacterium]MCB9965649.1 pirin family protein [Rhodospirillales bacterium]MCB9973073.1 pirin family protein [Rhodospirillales bacterium]
MKIKKIARINRGTGQHWVGNGFPVNTLFSYSQQGHDISPFLLLDYAGPADFEPSDHPRGVEQHPHRGFETVTIVYQGEIEHKDNAGNFGKIGPGDVQWMTAARGILHEEMHGSDFTKKGGTLEMIQLWVNLPAKDKMSAPHYQEILNSKIPVVKMDDNGGTVRVIAGNYANTKGAAKTFTPVNLWDMRLKTGHIIDLPLPEGFTTNVLILSGNVQINGEETLNEKELVLFEREGDYISLKAISDTSILIMNGEPIDEPIAGQGPFVMNTQDEIKQAMNDYRSGRF